MSYNSNKKILRAERANTNKLLRAVVIFEITAVCAYILLSVLSGLPAFEQTESLKLFTPASVVSSHAPQVAAGADAAKLLLLVPMILPIVFTVLFTVSVIKVRRDRFNLAFVIPVAVLVTLCGVMSVVSLFLGRSLDCYCYLGFELLSVLTLMVYNLIDNRINLNIKASVRRAGLIGVCVCMLALGFTDRATGGHNDTINDSVREEINASQTVE